MTCPQLYEIDKSKLAELWFGDYSVDSIAEYFGCSRWTILNRRREYGLPNRHRKSRRGIEAHQKAEPPKPAEKPLPDDLSEALAASRGRWSALSQIAANHSLTMVQVQQRYHRMTANG